MFDLDKNQKEVIMPLWLHSQYSCIVEIYPNLATVSLQLPKFDDKRKVLQYWKRKHDVVT